MVKIESSLRKGCINIPPSKSDSQRTIIAAALSKGTSIIRNIGNSRDEQLLLENIEKLGCEVSVNWDQTRITGISSFPNKLSLNTGESGLGLRLLSMLCAAHEGVYKMNGTGSILKRPQYFFEKYLTQVGVKVESNNGFLPLIIHGGLKSGQLEVDGSLSSQFTSGLLMVFPVLNGSTTLRVRSMKSKPYIDMTINTLKKFDVKVTHENYEVFRIEGNQYYNACKYTIEGDWSSASCWLAAAAIGNEISVAGLSTSSSQADIRMIEALEKSNCKIIDIEGRIGVDGKNRTPFIFDATDCPDLFPALLILASFCEGTSVIHGVSRLKYKESNRGVVLQEEFGKLGVKIEIDDDRMTIYGGEKKYGAAVSSHNDHRIAMCLGIMATKVEGIEIDGSEAVAKSYPEFWEHFNALETIGH